MTLEARVKKLEREIELLKALRTLSKVDGKKYSSQKNRKRILAIKA